MNQSNALRQLENILDEAIKSGDPKQLSAPILLAAMGLEIKSQNIMDFYELLNKSETEARKLRNVPKLDRYIKVVEDLQVIFANNNAWSTPWGHISPHIENTNVLATLDALANYLYSQNPQLLMEEEFLGQLHSELDSLIEETLASNLSKEVKLFLIERLEEIIKAIRRYIIDGTEGLSKAAKSLVVDFALTEKRLKDEDKQEPIFNKIKSWGLTLVLAFATPSPWDIVGAECIPVLQDSC